MLDETSSSPSFLLRSSRRDSTGNKNGSYHELYIEKTVAGIMRIAEIDAISRLVALTEEKLYCHFGVPCMILSTNYTLSRTERVRKRDTVLLIGRILVIAVLVEVDMLH